MDKLAIVISNYIDVECDANTTPRQAYERGFRRAYNKCETVMHSRKAEKEKALMENDRLKAENAKLREFVQHVADGVYEGLLCCDKCRFFDGCYNNKKKEHNGRGCQWLLWSRELGIEVDK
ncbi:MAG: hypothetical protein IKG21_13065 [Atopobiaceae bacterium]|nr:hypothetical protein [Atopobiaceae bacterium]